MGFLARPFGFDVWSLGLGLSVLMFLVRPFGFGVSVRPFGSGVSG